MAAPGAASQPDFSAEQYMSRWERTWRPSEGEVLQPGEKFDIAGPSPSLCHHLKAGKVQVAGHRVLVPGCG